MRAPRGAAILRPLRALALSIEGGVGGYVALATGTLFVLTAVVVQLVSVYDGRTHDRMEVSSVVTRTGSLTGHHLAPWQLSVRYSVAGRAIDTTVSEPVDLVDGRQYHAGDQITVDVDRRNYADARVRQPDSRHDTVEAVLFGSVLMAMGRTAIRNWTAVRRMESDRAQV